MNTSLSAGARSTRPSPTSRTNRNTSDRLEEQPVQPIGRDAHRHGVEPPPALVTVEHRRIAGIESQSRGIDDGLRERGHIPQAEIKPLPGDRMDHVSGIADQREPVGHERASHRQAERIGLARTDRVDAAKPKAKTFFELGVKNPHRAAR